MRSIQNIAVATVLAVAGLALGPSASSAAPLANASVPLAKRDPTISSSQVAVLKTYATLASISYCTVTGWACGTYCNEFPGTQVLNSFTSPLDDNQGGYVAWVPSLNQLVVSFRGSSNIQNFLADENIILMNYAPATGALVHTGFYTNFESVQSTVVSTVKSYLAAHSNVNVVVTGHSLGAAVALLSALDLFQKGLITTSNSKVYTYGEPRVGNPTFANYVDGTGLSISRVTHSHDPVPQVPYQYDGYQHHKSEFWIQADDVTTWACVGQEDPTCSLSTVLTPSTTDHLIYYESIGLCV